MSRNYDNWERLVAAVLRKELLWKICHEQSRTPSLRSSISSDFSSSFRSSASFSDATFDFSNPKDGFLKSAQPLPFQTVAGIRTSVRPETKEKAGKLVLFKGSPFAFSLEELLMAPSFVLGEEINTFKNTYVVSFKEDTMVVVKRWGRGDATRQVLEQRLKTIRSMEHENVVRLRGYFFTEDESFGFYDYFHQGSLHAILHGRKGEINRVHLEWEGRIRIAIGAAKGLLHIHRQSGNFIHGSVKTSNIFVNSQDYGCVDIKPEFEISFKNRLYHAPEVYIKKEFSQAGDVYSFGVVLIELFSGRSPMHYSGRHETFADWALHNACDEWTTMVFDRELLKYSLAKQAMWDMFGVALSCVKKQPQERPEMKDVVQMLELIPATFPV